MMRAVLLSVFVGLVFGCGQPPVVTEDSGTPDAAVVDEDAGLDAGEPDGGEPDAGEPDAGEPDAGTDPDAGFDAGPPVYDAGGVFVGCPVPSGGPGFRVRAMAANLTSGNLQSYDPGDGIRIMQGADPDVVMIQEFNYGARDPVAIADLVATTFDNTFSYYRGAGGIPNGVISRWPVVAQGEWGGQSPDRNLTWALVDIPGPNDLWVISVHLPTSSAGARNTDALTIIRAMDGGIPPGDYVLIGGDFNTSTRSENCFSTFAQRFKTTGPHPVDQLGNEDTNTSRTKPYDNVFASSCLARRQVPTVVGTSVYDAGLVIDTRVYTPLTDIAPAQVGDSDATGMQHMGVVKDFFILP